jgi:hypothetical protein
MVSDDQQFAIFVLCEGKNRKHKDRQSTALPMAIAPMA